MHSFVYWICKSLGKYFLFILNSGCINLYIIIYLKLFLVISAGNIIYNSQEEIFHLNVITCAKSVDDVKSQNLLTSFERA